VGRGGGNPLDHTVLDLSQENAARGHADGGVARWDQSPGGGAFPDRPGMGCDGCWLYQLAVGAG
jgi:hypothetical protein